MATFQLLLYILAQPQLPAPTIERGGLPIAKQKKSDDEALLNAMNAAAHHFAASGGVDHLSAVLDQYPQLLKRCLGQSHPKNAYDHLSLLHRAAHFGHDEVVAMLLDRGVDIEMDSGHGRTAVHLAAEANRPNILKLLAARGACLDAMTKPEPSVPIPGGIYSSTTQSGEVPAKSALDIARTANAKESVKYLEEFFRKYKK